MEIPKHVKHWNILKLEVEKLGINYEEFVEDCRISSLHKEFLSKYNFDKSMIWLF